MIVVEFLLAILFARWGAMLTGVGFETAEKFIGWIFLLFAIALAGFAGGKARAVPVVRSPYVITLQWAPAPLVDGGYARCKAPGGCHGLAAPYPEIIAKPGDVLTYAWNGVSIDNRIIAALWPIGQYRTKTPYVGLEGFADEWEGVKPL